jgi:hypothetical protein
MNVDAGAFWMLIPIAEKHRSSKVATLTTTLVAVPDPSKTDPMGQDKIAETFFHEESTLRGMLHSLLAANWNVLYDGPEE